MGTVVKTIVVQAPIDEVFAYWRNFENFPNFMENIESIENLGPDLTRWRAKGPLGVAVEWEARTTYVEENKKIAWVTTGGEIEIHGAVVFKPIDHGQTEVTVGFEYTAPAGALGEAVAKIFSDPEDRLTEDLARFRNLVENRAVAASGLNRDTDTAHGTPASTYSTTATDDEADIEGAADASRDASDIEAVPGVRS